MVPDERSRLDEARQKRVGRRPRRRWYQFGLLSLLILTTLAAVGAALWRLYVEPYRQQQAAMAVIERLGGRYETQESDTWLRYVIGHSLQDVTLVDLVDSDRIGADKPDEYMGHVLNLPRLSVLAISGETFTDAHLARLRRARHLRLLVLDGTSVTEWGIASLHEAIPEIEVYISQRRTIADLMGRASVMTAYNALCATYGQHLDYAYFAEATSVRGTDRFSDDDLALVAALSSRLEVLDLRSTQVTDAGLAHLEGLTSLQFLELFDTAVADDGLVYLKGLTSLQGLNLDSTRVSDSGLGHLKALTHLRWLSVSSTRVSEAGRAELRRALPTCSVIH